MTNILPRWRGFNLMEMYIYEPGRENIPFGREKTGLTMAAGWWYNRRILLNQTVG